MAAPAHGQDPFKLFGQGAETKAHAGAGIVHSRGAAANYYNPANLVLAPAGFAGNFGLDIVRLEYTYTYPDYVPIEIRRWVPIPFLGGTYRVLKPLVLGFSILPLPESSGAQKVDGLPTRLIALEPTAETEPSVVDVEQSGKGLGYKISLGVSWTLFPGFTAGLSILHDKTGSRTEVLDDLSGETVSIMTSETTSTQLLLGTRGTLFGGRLRLMGQVKLPSSGKIAGETSVPALGEEAKVDTGGSVKGPLALGLGIEGRLGSFFPFVEYAREQWSALADQTAYQGVSEVTLDYFDSSYYAFGSDYVFGRNRLSLAVGIYQSPLGDGIMAAESDDGEEIAGMQFQNYDMIPHARIAAGYRMAFKGGHLQSGLSYLSGSREVWEKARGYGTYELKIYTLIAGGSWRF